MSKSLSLLQFTSLELYAQYKTFRFVYVPQGYCDDGDTCWGISRLIWDLRKVRSVEKWGMIKESGEGNVFLTLRFFLKRVPKAIA